MIPAIVAGVVVATGGLAAYGKKITEEEEMEKSSKVTQETRWWGIPNDVKEDLD
ncbi:MAG: hypothetical protein FWG64_01010 [Firmicutes bacterium]|nr:hypothetical protein [Bacillota bacterium]